MDKKKKMILIAIIAVIVIIIIIFSLIILINKGEENGNIREKIDGTIEVLPEGDLGIEYNQEELREPTEFFSVERPYKM